jgi:hypothetical protein
MRVHELDFLLKSVPAALADEEKLKYLADLRSQIDFIHSKKSSGTIRDFNQRIDRSIQRIFSKNPELKARFSNQYSLWNRFFGKLSYCDAVLGRLSR